MYIIHLNQVKADVASIATAGNAAGNAVRNAAGNTVTALNSCNAVCTSYYTAATALADCMQVPFHSF